MFRKICALALCLLMVALPLVRADAMPSDQYFVRGKDALEFLAQGKTDDALKKLAFAYEASGDSDERFLQFVADYLPDLNRKDVQREVAVCYWESATNQWLLAIPISEPIDDEVKALVLLSHDFDTFTGYAVLTWGEVNEGTAASAYVWWNVEYNAGTQALYAD